MKALKLLALVAMCMAGSYASAQDLIVKKDGSVIQAKVTKIGTSEVEYKKWNNQDGPQYSIAVADILAINYQNGEKETFENVSASGKSQPAKSEADGQQSIVQVKPEDLSPEAKAANDALIAKYNASVELLFDDKYKKDFGKKKAGNVLAIYDVRHNSILTNDDLEIKLIFGSLTKHFKNKPAKWDEGGGSDCDQAVVLNIHNKTNRIIYLDLGNTFFVSMGQATCYYVPSSTTTTQGSSSGGSVNLGAVTGALGVGGVAGTLANGINVGGGSTNSSTSTTYSQRVKAIPPMSSINLPSQYLFGREAKEVSQGLYLTKDKVSYDSFWTSINIPTDSEKGYIKVGDSYKYTEELSPIQLSFVVAYSYTENCVSESTMTSYIYLKELLGTHWHVKEVKGNALFNYFLVGSSKNGNYGEFPRY